MSYLKKIEYKIILKESFLVIRNCSGCGVKSRYINTNRFRVNANGNKIDVWLIYQCEKCRHTFNLAIYERQNPLNVPETEYNLFLSNDEELAQKYGKDSQFFKKNKAEIDYKNIDFDLVKLLESEENESEERILILVHNPYGLKIRVEKQIAIALGLSISNVKKMILQGKISIDKESVQCVSFYVSKEILSN